MSARDLVQRFVDIWRVGDMEPLRSFTTKDCVFQLLPRSMGHAPMTIDQYIQLIQPGLAEWGKDGGPKINIEILDYIESAAGDKATAHVSCPSARSR